MPDSKDTRAVGTKGVVTKHGHYYGWHVEVVARHEGRIETKLLPGGDTIMLRDEDFLPDPVDGPAQLCAGCGKPFTSPDHDPRCSSCAESGTGPEPTREEVAKLFEMVQQHIWGDRLIGARMALDALSKIKALIPGVGMPKRTYLAKVNELRRLMECARMRDENQLAMDRIIAEYLSTVPKHLVNSHTTTSSALIVAEWHKRKCEETQAQIASIRRELIADENP